MMTSRDEVYAAIDGERDYQDTLDHPIDPGVKSVAAEVLLINAYAQRAMNAWVDNKGDVNALRVVRKIAGLCVRCMEHHGAPKR